MPKFSHINIGEINISCDLVINYEIGVFVPVDIPVMDIFTTVEDCARFTVSEIGYITAHDLYFVFW